MVASISRWALLSALVFAASDGAYPFRRTSSSNNNNPEQNYVLRWAASGGGWRAMTAHMAFANLFAQAGLLGPEASKFSAISSNSGGSWFTTQFFYSQEFYSRVIGSESDLNDLIFSWMQAYADMQYTMTNTPGDACELIDSLTGDFSDEDFCNIFMYNNGSWAEFIDAMLQTTSAIAYSDPSFVNRAADNNNRVPALSSTDLLIQMTLAPTAASTSPTDQTSTLSYIAPNSMANNENNGGEVYSVPLGILHTVKESGTSYTYGVEQEALPLIVQWSNAPEDFELDDWSSKYFLFSLDNIANGNVLTNPMSPVDSSSTLNPLFGGLTPTVTQVAAASSAAGGGLSGLSPSVLAQALSLLLAEQTTEERELEVDALFPLLSATDISADVAVCSQWPQTCGEQDAILLDGGYIDNNAFASNIGDYHQTSDSGDLSKTLKIILTAANTVDSDNAALFCSYFNTSFNCGVAPGEFVWPVLFANQAVEDFVTPNPVQSLQVFEEYMDSEILESLRVAVSGTSITSAIINATTVTNPAYGTTAGQNVQILYLETHSTIPTTILGYNETEFWTPYLASVAMDIASVGSEELLARIDAFLMM